MMAGVLLVLLGITGLGTAVKYFPRPVIIGFTNGIAILIASTQIRDFFGLRMDHVPGDFFHRMEAFGAAWHTISMPATALSIISVAIMIFCLKFAKRVPGAIVVTFGATIAIVLLHLPVETIGTRFHGIPSGLPTFAIPHFSYDTARQLLSPAFTVAMLGAIESLMSAVVSDRMSNDKHNPNVELMAQGIANLVSPLFGGLPATGAIARTATNVRAGAKTPVAGMIHSLTLLAIVLFAAKYVSNVPLAALAAILMIVAYNMGEWHEIPEILKLTAADIAVWLITMTLTVVADLTFAVEVGMVLAALMFIRKVSRTTTVARVTKDYVEDSRKHVLQGKDIPPYATVYRIHGPFLFGATDKFADILNELDSLPPIVILRLRNMTAIDATGPARFATWPTRSTPPAAFSCSAGLANNPPSSCIKPISSATSARKTSARASPMPSNAPRTSTRHSRLARPRSLPQKWSSHAGRARGSPHTDSETLSRQKSRRLFEAPAFACRNW